VDTSRHEEVREDYEELREDDMRVDYMESEAGVFWWAEKSQRTGELLDELETLAGIPAPALDQWISRHGGAPTPTNRRGVTKAWAAIALRGGALLAGPGTVSAHAEIARHMTLAEDYLANADDTYPLECGAYEPGLGISRTGLEAAEDSLADAWRILTAALRITRSLRALVGLALLAGRVTALRIRIAGRKAATLRIPPARALTPAAGALRSLTRAAHGPPVVGPYRLSVTAGGGHL